ncbi:MAG TPA: YidC/Oxa1 family membrane protein insertase [bacterium]|nr:YidC/Oxa1 family membrane protein insertase [bacterium]
MNAITTVINQIGYQAFYRPIYNALLLLYGLFEEAVSMGVVIVVFAVLLRLILLPLSLMQNISPALRSDVDQAIRAIQEKYPNNPEMEKKLTRKLLGENTGSLIASMLTLLIQTIVFYALYLVFTQGVQDETGKALYQSVEQPIQVNYVWLKKIDIRSPHQFLTLLTAFLIFIRTTLNIFVDLRSTRRQDKFLQYFLPVGAYMLLIRVPAALSIFIITIMTFSIAIMIIREIAGFIAKNFTAEPQADDTTERLGLFPDSVMPVDDDGTKQTQDVQVEQR